jgi:hypothetical protein
MCSCIGDGNWYCVSSSPFGCLYPSFYIQGGRGYKEGNRVGYNMIPIRTLSLLTYYTYISIDIIVYTLDNTP